MKRVLYILLFIPSLVWSQDVDTSAFDILEPYNFHLQYLITSPALLIDVREPFEYKKKRLADAINIPASGNIDVVADTLAKETVLFLYCTTESRSSRVATRMKAKGFEKIFLLQGGISFWKDEGYPLERKKAKKKK